MGREHADREGPSHNGAEGGGTARTHCRSDGGTTAEPFHLSDAFEHAGKRSSPGNVPGALVPMRKAPESYLSEPQAPAGVNTR